MRISVLVPVLGRPRNALPLMRSLRATSDAYLLFLCSLDDRDEIDAVLEACEADETGETEYVIVEWRSTERGGDYARKMNRGYELTDSDWVLLGADDISFGPGWDTQLERAAASGKRVLGTNDKANRLVARGVFSTHPLVARSYVEEHGGCLEGPGQLVSEVYDHNFPDRELAALAQSRDEWLFVPSAVVQHNHPMIGKAENDDVYLKGRERFWEDQALFWERAKQWGYVGLIPQELSAMKRSSRRIERLSASARSRRARG